jgi:16S rRNA (cytidine1402-2'-O)-methyltransferase
MEAGASRLKRRHPGVGLTLVPTPLGNLRDITLRALDVLRDADLIAAEDTRVTRRLLTAHGLTGKRVVSYREQNAADATPALLESARTQTVALVCYAGMPGISDPGRALIVAARAAGVPVSVLPGPVAFTCAAVLSGFDLTGLTFEGFVPRSGGPRREALRSALSRKGPTAWYESPHRIVATLEALEVLASDARVFVARELTKLHEQQAFGTPQQVKDALAQPVRGEIVLVIEPRQAEREAATASDIESRIDALLDAGMSAAAAAKSLAAHDGMQRSSAYERVVARQRHRKGTQR